MIRTLLLTLVSILAVSATAQEVESTSVESESRMELSAVKPDFSNINLNLQLGMSSFDYSGDSSKSRSDQGVASAVTVELGNTARFLETGVMYFQSKAQGLADSSNQIEEINNAYLGIPLLAKGYFNGGSNGFFIKGGMITSFLMNSSQEDDVRKIDLIATLGVGSKFKMNQKADFLVEASYNRGFLDQLPSRGDTYQQGFVIMGGVSFKL